MGTHCSAVTLIEVNIGSLVILISGTTNAAALNTCYICKTYYIVYMCVLVGWGWGVLEALKAWMKMSLKFHTYVTCTFIVYQHALLTLPRTLN